MTDAALVALAYLLGGIPFGLVTARVFCSVDPRKEGSRNVGATNVARLCGAGWGVLTLVLDMLKGAVPVLLALKLAEYGPTPALAGFAAVLGHVFSPFLRFSGGKAVATTIGVMLCLAWWQTLVAVGACVAVIAFSGFVSLGSLTLVAALPALLALSGEFTLTALGLAIMALVFWRHRENINRLARGEEKSWKRKKQQPE